VVECLEPLLISENHVALGSKPLAERDKLPKILLCEGSRILKRNIKIAGRYWDYRPE
jgi:hypothetical protein